VDQNPACPSTPVNEICNLVEVRVKVKLLAVISPYLFGDKIIGMERWQLLGDILNVGNPCLFHF
jgi:hypothetical protein